MRAAHAGLERVVHLCIGVTAALQFRHTYVSFLAKFVKFPKANRLRGTGFRACRNHPSALPVVTKSAFERATVRMTLINNSERARHHTVAAAVANVGLHEDRTDVGADNRASWAGLKTSRIRTMFADVRKENPAERIFHIHLLWPRRRRLL